MIKGIVLVNRRRDVPAAEFPAAWREVVAGAAAAPPGVRPSRSAVCTTLADLTGPDARHDGAGLGWFADAGHLRCFQEWLRTPDGRRLVRQAGRVTDRAASPVLVTRESVLRGAGWLDRRWRDGGDRLKHMAVAVRADGLSPAEFAERWRVHSGRAAGRDAPKVIPDQVRGLAYVQNHPCPRATGEWAYDAVNEVYFDDPAGLRARIDWFRENMPGPVRDDLFRASWFLAVREQLVPA